MSDAFCRTAFTCWPDWRGRDLRFPSTPEKGQCAGLPYPPRLWQLQHETPVPPEKAQTQGRDKDRISKGFANLHRQPHGVFSDAHEMTLTTAQGSRVVSFASAIIAAGSRVFKLPGLPWDDPRVMDSTDALEMQDVPECLLAIEMGCGYFSRNHGLCSNLTTPFFSPFLPEECKL